MHHVFVALEDLPESLVALFERLRAAGYSEARLGNLRPGGQDRVRLVKGDMSVRSARRGADWVLELNCRAWGGGWYNAAVVRSALEHRSVAPPDDLDELSRFVGEHLFTTLAQVPPSDELRADLERLEVIRQSAERGLAP